MGARRCSTCAINWPINTPNCKQCGAVTWYSQSSQPTTPEELAHIEAQVTADTDPHAAFEAWLLTPQGLAAVEKARLEGDRRDQALAAIEQAIQ